MTLLTVTEYLWQFYGRHHDFVNRYWVIVSFTVVTMTLLTVTEYLWQFYGRHHDFVNVTEYLWQFYGRHHDFVNRYWVCVTVLRSSPWLC